MPRRLDYCHLIIFCFSLLAMPTVTLAQRTVTIERNFEPAFHIEPLVQRLDGRRGDVMQFQFRVTPANADANIEVALVGLRQDLSGQVTHDESNVDNQEIQLMNPGRFKVLRDIDHIIEGVLKVPQGDTSYYSYGILVRDFGDQRDRSSELDADGKELTKAGINFITQYVLRIDLHVTNARGEHANELALLDGGVTVDRGLPQLGAIIRNPSNTAFEFEMSAQVKRSPSDRSFKPVRMVMPVRQTMEGEERFVGRILPKSTIRMQEIMAEPLMSGQYQMDLEMTIAGRKVQRKSFTIDVDSSDFPAQEVLVSQVGGDVYVSPSRIELSQLRGGNRRVSLEFKNNSGEARTIRLDTETNRGTRIPGLLIQPKEFTLSAGRSRKLSVSLQRSNDFEAPLEYGKLVVTSQGSRQDFVQSGELPVAISFAESGEPAIVMEDIRWVESEKHPSFKALVSNSGSRHLALDARLLILSEVGRRIMLPAGYGRWLMPGDTTDLEFRIDAPLTPGKYQLICELQNGQKPIVKSQTISVSDFDSAKTVSTN